MKPKEYKPPCSVVADWGTQARHRQPRAVSIYWGPSKHKVSAPTAEAQPLKSNLQS